MNYEHTFNLKSFVMYNFEDRKSYIRSISMSKGYLHPLTFHT